MTEIKAGILITADMLEAKGASCPGLDEFKRVFPNGAELTKENIMLAAKEGLSLGWFVYCILLAPFWAELERQIAPFWAELERQIAPLRAELERQTARVLWGLLSKVDSLHLDRKSRRGLEWE